ncbi:MAG: hypothetical protein ACR2MP_22370 [Streptosporangiaceae bacterium]
MLQQTVAQARHVFNAFWPRYEQLPAHHSPGAPRGLTTGAELQAQLFFKGEPGPTITSLVQESLYVPRLTGYPRWFWAVGRDAGGSRNGHLFVMVQAGPSAPRKTAMALYDLNSSARMLHYVAIAITKGAQGYAEAVPLNDSTLDVPPSGMAATYASYLDGSTRSVGGLSRPARTRPPTSPSTRRFPRRGQYGWRDTDHQAPAQLPVYALRLSTQGALVIFSTYDTTAWMAASSSAALPPSPRGWRLATSHPRSWCRAWDSLRPRPACV